MLDVESVRDPERDAATLAVHTLDHFALTVPRIEDGRRFYEGFGLTTREGGDALDVACPNGRVGVLYEGPVRRLHHLSFAAHAAELPRFAERLAREGVPQIDPPAASDAEGIWFRDPDGNVVEIAARRRRMPTAKVPPRNASAEAGACGAPDFDTPVVPSRLGHCLLFTPDVDRMLRFYARVLGLRLSDRSGEIIGFMHTPHGSDHHVIAFARSDHAGFHHASFEVPNVDHIGLGAMHMAERGFRQGWGLGRHCIGSNYFHYVRDPWGSFAEYFCDIDYIPAGFGWNVRDVDPRFALHVWGPDVPAYFLENYEGRSAE